jgi:hypothetical protein
MEEVLLEELENIFCKLFGDFIAEEQESIIHTSLAIRNE